VIPTPVQRGLARVFVFWGALGGGVFFFVGLFFGFGGWGVWVRVGFGGGGGLWSLRSFLQVIIPTLFSSPVVFVRLLSPGPCFLSLLSSPLRLQGIFSHPDGKCAHYPFRYTSASPPRSPPTQNSKPSVGPFPTPSLSYPHEHVPHIFLPDIHPCHLFPAPETTSSILCFFFIRHPIAFGPLERQLP